MILTNIESVPGKKIVKLCGMVSGSTVRAKHAISDIGASIKNFFGGLNGDDYRSFPSGHTGSATCIIMLTLIPMRLCDKKWITYLVLGLTSAYSITMAISRVMIGAHYASDTLFALTCTIVWFALVYFVFYKKGWLNARSN